MKELLDKRTEKTKTYHVNGSEYRMDTYVEPMHYLNDGIWKDIQIFFEENGKNYLCLNNKVTVGFRKDLQLNKYLGLRYDYDHQLEYTPLSLLVDDVEYITKTSFDKIEYCIPNKFIHYMDDTQFITEIEKTDVKNFIKINAPFKTFAFKEELQMSNMDVSNKLTKGVLIPDDNNEYTITDIESDNFLFKIHKPFLRDSNGVIKYIDHKFEYKNSKYIYTKFMNDVDLSDLTFPIYIDANTNYYPNTVAYIQADGLMVYPENYWTNVVYTPSSVNYGFILNAGFSYSTQNGTTNIKRGFLNFDTSSIPNSAVLTSSKIQISFQNMGQIPQGETGTLRLAYGTHSDNLQLSDWNNYGSLITLVQYLYSNNNIEYNVPLNSINTSGITKYSLRSTDDEERYNWVKPSDNPFYNISVSYNIQTLYNQTKLMITYNYNKDGVIAFDPHREQNKYGQLEIVLSGVSMDMSKIVTGYSYLRLFTINDIGFDTNSIYNTTTSYSAFTHYNVDTSDYTVSLPISLIGEYESAPLKNLDVNDVISCTIKTGGTSYDLPIFDTYYDENYIYFKSVYTASSIPDNFYAFSILFKNRYMPDKTFSGDYYKRMDFFILSGRSVFNDTEVWPTYPGTSPRWTGYTNYILIKSPFYFVSYLNLDYYMDRFATMDNYNWYDGTFQGGSFSGTWYGGNWVNGTWLGKNALDGTINVPSSTITKSYIENTTTDFPTI